MVFIYWGISSVEQVICPDGTALPYRRPTRLYVEDGEAGAQAPYP